MLNTWCCLNHWYWLEIWHPGGFCVARCVFCTHFGREKVHFWGCSDWPLLQDISIINVIYQCCNVKYGARVLRMPASGRHSHKGQRGKRGNSVAPIPASSLIPVFPLRVAANLYASSWIWVGPFDGLCKKRCGFSWMWQHNFCVALATTAAPVPNSHQSCVGGRR